MSAPKLYKCHEGHIFNEKNTYYYAGRQYCRRCRAKKSREYWARSQEKKHGLPQKSVASKPELSSNQGFLKGGNTMAKKSKGAKKAPKKASKSKKKSK